MMILGGALSSLSTVLMAAALALTSPATKQSPPPTARFLATLHEVGTMCLNAQQEEELTSAIKLLEDFRLDSFGSEERKTDLTEIDDAIAFVLQWQDMLAQRHRGTESATRELQQRLANLSIGHLMIARSRIIVLPTADEIGPGKDQQVPPPDSDNFQQHRSKDGSKRLTWRQNNRDARYVIFEQEKDGSLIPAAEVPPSTTEFYIPASFPPTVSVEVDAAVTRAARTCLSAKTAADLDPVLEQFSLLWRRDRRQMDGIGLASQSQIDCALQFVCNWQDALAVRDAGRRVDGQYILLGMSLRTKLYPVLTAKEISAAQDNF